MNKKFTKKSIIESSLTMDTDTYNKMKGTLDDKDKVKVVPKGSLNNNDSTISEDDSNDDIIPTYGKDLKIGNFLSGKDGVSEIVDINANGHADLVLTLKNVKTNNQKKLKFNFNKKYATCNNPSIHEEFDSQNRSVEYGYDPELDGDSWEEFMNSLEQENINHTKNSDENGEINEVKLKKSDFNKLKNKKNGSKI